MKHPVVACLVTAAGLVLFGCGGSGGEGRTEGSQASASASPEPEPVEAADCRQTLDTVAQIAAAIGAQTSDDALAGQFNRLRQLSDRADTTCSNAVMQPLTEGIYELSVANLYQTLCSNGTDASCDADRISTQVIKALDPLEKATTAAEATSP